ncbi:MAG: hypothetical protein EDM03_03360 [Porphyrobacter sp. IPPAS B-1204]|nr:MAG: hypothetical protein EDM03_03360 [Porphyrobacter sp. IPPAS B-1204]
MRYVALACAALGLVTSAASARAETLHSFTVGSTAFTLPVPEGYCLPTDANVAQAEKVAALDTLNLTHATLDRCGSFGQEYAHIKSPRQWQPVPMPRADFLALIARELQTANGQQLVGEAIENAERDVAKGTSEEIKIDTAVPRFAGQDDICVYMAMTGDVMNAQGTVSMRGVICMTVIDGEFMNINTYAIVGTGLTFDQLKTRARAIALSIAPAG